MFTLKLLESDKQIQNTINQLLATEIKQVLPKIGNRAAQFIKTSIINSIKNQPEYFSLLNGKLRHEFGLPDADSRVASILDGIEQSLNIRYNSVSFNSNNITGGFTITMVPSGFNDILSLPAAVFETEKGSSLQWLKWLLLEGDNSIVFGYKFILGQSPYSRTGQGIMRSDVSGVWRVPPEFAGTEDNNWITRAISSTEADINNFLQNLFKSI